MTQRLFRLVLGVVLAAAVCGKGAAADRVTILYDAFGDSKGLTKDWGFSALVEHDGKRILFDSGNNAEIFERNVKALGVDLTKIDFAVISHRHSSKSVRPIRRHINLHRRIHPQQILHTRRMIRMPV